jgi:hypothetical protein
VPAATASSANDKSRADWNRSSGCFSRQRRTTFSVAGPAVLLIRGRSAGSAFRIALTVSAGVSRTNAA